MAVLDTITFRLQADVAQFQNGLAQASGSVNSFTTNAGASHRAVSLFRAGLTGLAVQATGVSGPVGRLAQAMLLFSGGGALVLGAAAGIGVIATAYQHLAKRAEEAEAAQRKLAEFRTSRLQAIGAITDPAQAENAVQRLREMRSLFAEQTRDMSTLSGVLGEATFDATKLADAMLGRLGPAAKDTAQQIAALEAAIRAVDLARWKEFNEEQAAFIQQMQQLATIPPPEVKPFIFDPDDIHDVGKEVGKRFAEGIEEGFRQAAADLKRAVKTELGKLKDVTQDVQTQMEQMGRDAIRAFVSGIIDGTADFFDLLASVLKSFLIGTVTDAIGGFLFGSGGSKVGFASTAGEGRVIPELNPSVMTPAMNLTVNLPPARSPFDMARDADWQRALRESLTVAKGGGFR